MSKFGRRLGILVVAAALAGCMSGHSSLLATQGHGGGAIASSGSQLIGPSQSVAANGLAPARAVNLIAPAPSTVPAIQISSALAAHTGALAAAGQTSLAITPTLAPASSVGASVAAVSQPLNLSAAAQVSTARGSRTSVVATVKLKAAGVGVSAHVGP